MRKRKQLNSRLRVGCVPFLNAKPFLEGLNAEITLLPPNLLAARFREGEFEAALLPSIEALREGYEIIPGLSISSDGKTDSVLLHHRVAIPEIHRVALDQNSRTSNALTRILLELKYRVFPAYVTRDPSKGLASNMDAALTIGDLSFQKFGLPYLDLGSEWKAFTGKPFVYAVWVCRRGNPRIKDIGSALQNALERGKLAVRDIARREASRLGVSEDFCVAYLTRFISYELEKNEQDGLREFDLYARQIEMLV